MLQDAAMPGGRSRMLLYPELTTATAPVAGMDPKVLGRSCSSSHGPGSACPLLAHSWGPVPFLVGLSGKRA